MSLSLTYYCQVAKKTLVILMTCLLAGAFFHDAPTFAASQVTNNHYYRIPGVVVPRLFGHASTGLTAPDKIIPLSLHLSLRNETLLNAILAAQANPTSPFYHHYLTPQTFRNQFGPTQNSINSVVEFLKEHNLTVHSISPNNLSIQASGPVSSIEKTFLLALHNYTVEGHTIYAPSLNPAIPDHIVSSLQNIVGLDNLPSYLPRYQKPSEISPRSTRNYGYTPSDLRSAYDVNPLIKAGGNGSGQTVALFELDGYKPSDIDTYLDRYQLGPRRYSNVLIDGATSTAGASAGETTLDMELISAIAPNAMQKIYIGPNTTLGANDIYSTIVNDNQAKVVSISWGQCEEATGNAEIETLHDIFQQGAAQGQSFFAASGDAGAYDCGDQSLSVDSPADQPNVVGVGGTKLTLNNDGTYNSESAWSMNTSTQTAGGGGGLSFYFPRPAYQTGPNLTNSFRMVPDISANADPATGYSVFCTVNNDVCNGWSVVGGTSGAAPLWAAMAADVNGYLISQRKWSLGNVNSTIYTLYNTPQLYPAYHDVTTGTNLFYQATTGYDLATGIGSPDAWNFARDLTGLFYITREKHLFT